MGAKPLHYPNLDERAVNVFTDGSSLSGPRRGGIGYRIVVVGDDGHPQEIDSHEPGYEKGTNNEMELKACIEALELLGGRHSPVDVADFSKVVVWTDSLYVSENYRRALTIWPQRRWMNRDGNPILNARLWKELVRAAQKVSVRVDIRWHKGHSATNPHNKAADSLAKESARGPLRPPLSINRVRRKQSPEITEVGSIRAEGQRITLHVVTDEYLPVQKIYRYRCEVMSKGSPYRGKVDWLYSNLLLDAGHTYYVQLNDEPKRPRIVRVFREVERQ